VAQDAGVDGAGAELRGDLVRAERVGVGEPDDVARSLGKLGQAVLEVDHVVADEITRIRGRLAHRRGQRAAVPLPQRLAPFLLADAIGGEVAADAEHEAAEARRIVDRAVAQRFDQHQHHVLGELVDRLGLAQPAPREQAHRALEAPAQIRLGVAIAGARARDQRGDRCLGPDGGGGGRRHRRKR
jgi:hypothetical protein